MLKAISSHVFLQQRLHPGLLDVFARAGAQGVELFAARQHFDYTSRPHVRELADWFRSNTVEPFSMHAPMFPDAEMGRGGTPAVNVIHPDKARRIDGMDEIKRALEHAITALEHLRTYASPLGVRLLIENLQSDVATPAHLLEILNVAHLDTIGVCLDVGHAHLADGVPAALTELRDRIRSTHLHDNKGDKDTHLWPGEGTISWDDTLQELRSAPQTPAGVLEIHYNLGETTDSVAEKARRAFDKF